MTRTVRSGAPIGSRASHLLALLACSMSQSDGYMIALHKFLMCLPIFTSRRYQEQSHWPRGCLNPLIHVLTREVWKLHPPISKGDAQNMSLLLSASITLCYCRWCVHYPTRAGGVNTLVTYAVNDDVGSPNPPVLLRAFASCPYVIFLCIFCLPLPFLSPLPFSFLYQFFSSFAWCLCFWELHLSMKPCQILKRLR